MSPAATWTEIDQLIHAGAYKQLVRLLQARRSASIKDGDESQIAVLTAVDQLCLACIQLHQQQADHEQALQQVTRLEGDTRRRIGQLLRPFWQEDRIDPGDPTPASLPSQVSRATRGPSGGTTTVAARVRWQLLKRRLEHLIRPVERKTPTQAGPVHLVSHVIPDPPPFTRQSRVAPATVANPDLNVYCLGTFRTYYHEQLIQDWSGNKSRSLFKFLLVNRDKAVHVDQLLDLFWRDSPPDAARRSLYQTIYLVRQAVCPDKSGHPCIVQVKGGYQLNPDLSVWVDSEAFLHRYHRGLELARRGDEHESAKELLAAEILYEGDYLIEDLYEDWSAAAREQLRNAYLDVLDRLSIYYQSTDRNALCIAYCRKLLEIDGCREDVHRRLMLAFVREGQRSLALRQYHRCVESLRDELDVDPLPPTVELYKKLLNNEDHFLQVVDLNSD